MCAVYDDAKAAFDASDDWTLQWDPDGYSRESIYDLDETEASTHITEQGNETVATLTFGPFKDAYDDDDLSRADVAHIEHLRRDLVADSDLDLKQAGDLTEFVDYVVQTSLDRDSDVAAYASEFADLGRQVQNVYDDHF